MNSSLSPLYNHLHGADLFVVFRDHGLQLSHCGFSFYHSVHQLQVPSPKHCIKFTFQFHFGIRSGRQNRQSQAKEALEKYVFDSRNVLNKLIYEVKKRQRVLVELNSYLETLKLMQLAEKPDSAEQQRIRQLENSIEKVETKLAAAKAIHRTYLKILDYLKEEVLCFPLSLGVIANTVASYSHELATMTQMAGEASVARDAITSELSELEKRFIEERKTRENAMNWQRRMLKELVDKPHLRRDGPKKVTNEELESLLGRETPVQGKYQLQPPTLSNGAQKILTLI
ncbi:hypothetical protein NDU88_011926 [Pleurodeles waltl]|uniref:Uncharacterized protein n=1 Tax=Pleurodeles waltl TaxID=8319 RepID=A0AAV7R4U9_PLEWA|nr:hypothetical protein NDU88_011926 [Pleurodeles waltl]